MRYNTVCEFSFQIIHDHDDPDDITLEEILYAIRKRLRTLSMEPPETARQAFNTEDTIDNEE